MSTNKCTRNNYWYAFILSVLFIISFNLSHFFIEILPPTPASTQHQVVAPVTPPPLQRATRRTTATSGRASVTNNLLASTSVSVGSNG